jgi:hypothetical protein
MIIRQDIYEKYCGIENPYREMLTTGDSVVAYEYSDLIPAWHLEYFYSEKGFPKDLIRTAISKSESRNFYSFYYLCDLKDLQQYTNNMKETDHRYQIILEETIPSNERSINNLFWTWVCKTISKPEETCIILNILPGTYR